VDGWLFQSLEKDVRHVGGHPISAGENTDSAQPFVGPIGKISLHLPHLIHLDGLILRFQDQNIRMEAIADLSARGTLVTCVPYFLVSFKTVKSLCKLKGDPFFSNPFAAKKEIAVCHLPRDNPSPKQFHRHGMSQDIFEGHDKTLFLLGPVLSPRERRTNCFCI
jgi:hypothetical protein